MELWEAQRLYKRHHEMTLEKREISKAQKELMGDVKEYLEQHPEGFDVDLVDARDRSHTYHIQQEEQTRAVLDKNAIQYELEKKSIHVKLTALTPGYLAELVEKGFLDSKLIRENEDVSTHDRVKKKKVRRPLTIAERGGAA